MCQIKAAATSSPRPFLIALQMLSEVLIGGMLASFSLTIATPQSLRVVAG
ncbi:MAG: hypothetical protein H0W38_04895 [Methylibium sp.]|nr:hypothetical protein [Methylibium sp.]